MSKRLENLNDIVGVLNSGAKFYRHSARQTSGTELEKVFLEHAELREAAARTIADIVDDAGAEPAEAAPMEEARAWATRVGSAFGDTADMLVGSLEEHEDRTLGVLRQAIHHKDNHRDEAMLREFMEQFEKSHERMHALRHSQDPKKAATEITGSTETTGGEEARK